MKKEDGQRMRSWWFNPSQQQGAALALENARLFEETVRRADQEETIAHITT